ncbi:MAG: hypothetical protein MK141_14175 [Pseudoxanthomonas sp.]|nr:hypothetical protein [Pseudoxanthomonas sp.]
MRQIDIVRRLGMPLTSRAIVSHVIHRLGRSQKVEKEIALVLGKPLFEVFPDWYRKDGKTAKRKVA